MKHCQTLVSVFTIRSCITITDEIMLVSVDVTPSHYPNRPVFEDDTSQKVPNAIAPVSPLAEEDDIIKKGVHAQVTERDNDSNSDGVRPGDTAKLPDWRPRPLTRLPNIAMKTIFGYIVFYLIIWGVTYRRKYIFTTSSKKDWVFRYGPVFLALVVTEMVTRIAADFLSILPYMALASNSRSPLRKRFSARLTEPDSKLATFVAPLRKPFRFLLAYCFLVLIPSQTAVFDDSQEVNLTWDTTFRSLPLEALPNITTNSIFPQIAMDAIFHGDESGGFKWVSKMLKTGDQNTYSWTDPFWAAILPFTLPGDTNPLNAATQQHDANYTVRTSALYSYLNCSQIDIIKVTASELILAGSARNASGVVLRLEDRDGCTVEREFADISGVLPPEPNNPLLANGTFALWQSATSLNVSYNAPRGAYCPKEKQYIVSGPLINSNATEVEINGKTSGWGGLSCIPIYYALRGSLKYELIPYEQSEPFAAIYPGNGTRLEKQKDEPLIDAVRIPMENNYLNTGLIYNMSSPLLSMSYWAEPLPHTIFDPILLGRLNLNCVSLRQPFGTSPMHWDNEQACKMFVIVADMWSLLAAATVATLTPFTDQNDWENVEGTIRQMVTAWRLSAFDLFYTILFYLAFLILLLVNVKSTMGVRLSLDCTSRSYWRSGLQCSPTSIAGIAYLFQDASVRRLFEGVDAMNRPDAKAYNISGIGAAKLKLCGTAVGSSKTDSKTIVMLQEPGKVPPSRSFLHILTY